MLEGAFGQDPITAAPTTHMDITFPTHVGKLSLEKASISVAWSIAF